MCSKLLKEEERLSIILRIKAEVNEEIGVQERSGEWWPPVFIASSSLGLHLSLLAWSESLLKWWFIHGEALSKGAN